MYTIPFTMSDNAITVYLNGVPYPVDSSHPNWATIMDGLKAKNVSVADMLKLVSVRSFISGLNIGNVTVSVDAVLYKGQPVHGHLANRMLEIVGAGLDVAPWAKFMDNLMLNPSATAVDELYLWLEKAKMPITEDGHFLAYKKVKDDFTSYHSNADGSACHNDIGTVVEMPRNKVDDRRHNTCSQGLHFCSWEYLPEYMGSQGKVVVVKIDPADVVSIPSDYDNAKGRAWRYLILSEVDQSKTAFAFEGQLIVNETGDEEMEDSYEAWQADVTSGSTELSYDD